MRDEMCFAYCQRCGRAMIAPLKQDEMNGIMIKGELNVLCLGCAKAVMMLAAGNPGRNVPIGVETRGADCKGIQ